MKSRVIGLGGALRSGKDTVADYLVEQHGFVKIGMSDPLNEALLALNPLVGMGVRMQEEVSSKFGFSRIKETVEVRYADYHDRVGYVEAKKNPEVRALLQRLGTEVGRNILGENVWVDLAVKRINALVTEGKSVVITGVRFPNEVRMFERVTGAIVTTAWVNRPHGNELTGGAHGHASEQSTGEQDFDKVIQNTGSLDDLYAIINPTFNL